MIKTMYFIATMLISDHTISESTPYTLAAVGSKPYSALKHS